MMPMHTQYLGGADGIFFVPQGRQEVSVVEPESPEIGADQGVTAEHVYAEAARHFLDVQITTLDVLDGRTTQTFSVGSVVLPVTFALLNLGDARAPAVAEWALISALACYVALLLCATQASRLRVLEYRPHIPTLKQHSLRYAGRTLQRWVADEHERSIRLNTEVLTRKGRWVGIATVALYAEGFSVSVAAIATLLT